MALSNKAAAAEPRIQLPQAPANQPPKEANYSQEWSLKILSSPGAADSLHALQNAVDTFNREVSPKKRHELIDKKAQFSSILIQAQKDLEDYTRKPEPEKKLRNAWYQTKRGLEKFCRYAHQYAGVMDVMVSSHPEIAALAWGAMKFLLVVSVGHQELKAQITYHLGEIGARFQIMECFAQLYPSDAMVSNVSGAYSEFLTFLRKSIEWCKEAVLVKFIKTVFSSYETRIKPTIDNLNDYMEKIRTSAEVNRSIGIYNLQVGNLSIQNLIAALGDGMSLQGQENRDFQRFVRSYLVAETSRRLPIEQKMRKRKKIDREVFRDSSTLRKSIFPALLQIEEHLDKEAHQSRAIPKGKSYIDMDIINKPEISSWVESSTSSFLWIDGFILPCGSRWTTELAIDVTLAGDQEGDTMLFYFSNMSTKATDEVEELYLGSQFAMLHSFIVQLVQQHPSIIEKHPELFNFEVFTKAKNNLKITLTILREALGALPENTTVCIVVDSVDDLHGAKERSPRIHFILEKLSELVTRPRKIVVKILVTSITSGVHETLFPEGEDPPFGHTLLRIPRNIENAHAIRKPSHLTRRIPKRLVRVPDEEFTLKPVDSFELSDDDADNESDISLDDPISATEIMESQSFQKTALKKSHSFGGPAGPFQTVREAFPGNDDESSSSNISISDTDEVVLAVQEQGGMPSDDDFDLSSTDSEQ